MNWRGPNRGPSRGRNGRWVRKRETSRRARFPGASELSSVAAHPVSVSPSVSVAAPTTSPPTLARTSTAGTTCSIERAGSARGTGHRWLHLAAPLLARRRPRRPRTTATTAHHVRYSDTSLIRPPRLRTRQRQLVLVRRRDRPWDRAGPGLVPAPSALTPRRTRPCAARGRSVEGRHGPPHRRGAAAGGERRVAVLHAQLYGGHGRSDLGTLEVHAQHRCGRRSSAVPARSPVGSIFPG